MSKMDDLRAMREAKFARGQARGGQPAVRRTVPVPVAPEEPRPAGVPDAADAGDTGDDSVCGHRNISGRTCTRERGHSAKSHRYS